MSDKREGKFREKIHERGIEAKDKERDGIGDWGWRFE